VQRSKRHARVLTRSGAVIGNTITERSLAEIASQALCHSEHFASCVGAQKANKFKSYGVFPSETPKATVEIQ